ncbi:MAG: hypothetical protein MR282_00155 [Veillonella caviae]|nr:hypothetical protein [Veillonella caviae]
MVTRQGMKRLYGEEKV